MVSSNKDSNVVRVAAASKTKNQAFTQTSSKPRLAQGERSTVQAKRVRAPKDLAKQYGEQTRKPRPAKTTQKERRARRSAAAKARLQEWMTPDEQLLARLARAGVIASSLAPEGALHDDAKFKAPKTPGAATRRPRKWESRCGKCGALSTFKSAAGVCAKCGAIAVRS